MSDSKTNGWTEPLDVKDMSNEKRTTVHKTSLTHYRIQTLYLIIIILKKPSYTKSKRTTSIKENVETLHNIYYTYSIY